MPMELRKRKTPPPPPPPRVKRTKSTADAKADNKPAAKAAAKPKAAPASKRVKDAVVTTAEKVVAAVEDAVAPATEDKESKATPAAAAKTAAAKKTEVKEPKEKKKTAAQEKKEKVAEEKKVAAEEKKAAAEEKKAAAAAAAEEKKDAAAAAAVEEKPVEEKKADEKPAEEKKTVTLLKVGDSIPEELAGVKTEEGESTSLKTLLEKSEKGIIVFAYPAASTPGCTKQACHFRDSHTAFTTAGYSIFGLSGDAPKKNKAFVTNQKLTYPLLCDEEYTLHEAFGIKKTSGKKTSTERSVFAVTKDGKIALLQKGTPDGTWEAAKKFAGI
ncbi:AhpC-TSA-domain-containing protein [Ascobolus immersus RN42]|uniref:thioredoxin-dependent peroxiredoxin n=1 Tax=Ascobolus immersus RN42 TaxID=1160509 RepID=A0A3N4IDX8_ASCIM|nr:AhpC-TSA-domain-containing protein [Ascobolus immersus RN42]